MSTVVRSVLTLVVAGVTTASSLLASSGTVAFHGLRVRRLKSYADEDGEASEDDVREYTDRIPKALAFLLVIFDLSLVIARFVDVFDLPLSGAEVVARILTAAQVAYLFVVPESTQRFTIGICAASSCATGAILSAYQVYQSESETRRGTNIAAITDVVLLLLTAICTLSLPRRPSISQDGRLVDAQYTVSAVQRYSFAWPRTLLYKAKVTGRLEYDDLPVLHLAARSERLLHHFQSVYSRARLRSVWIKIFVAHRGLFCQQWALTIASSLALYAPQLCMLRILRLLEAHDTPEFSASSLWFWVAALGLSKMAQVVVESWLEWINWAMLSVPVRSQLAAMIFQKSLRTKHIKGATAVTNTSGATTAGQEVGLDESEEGYPLLPTNDDNSGAVDTVDKDEDASFGLQQGIINLIGVDTVRIASFAAENNLLLSTVVNLGLALAILFGLLGWLGVCAGLVMPILLTPLNLWATRSYSDAQDAVMNIRDQRMALVGEALQGIRQIKFSAVEERWQAMINAIRSRELEQQWLVYVLTSGLLCVWMAAPLLFSTVSLAVHAWQNGGMSSATAFVSLSIFSTLEYALSVVPNLITEAIDANVSIKRIEEHLKKQEKTMPTLDGSNVEFEQTTVRWPSEGNTGSSFSLRDLNLRFPTAQLSVVCGKTGCGKTLLLNSILGEADVMRGSIKLPAGQAKATTDWVDHSHVAYVAQIPWTENASIRDNILFGLPYIQERYEQVLWACALEQDLEIMPDNDSTEVGANGINLSGGQRWRITFARALYSRAGTLVLDDIFSAVDAHVGRHILQHGLLGDLAAGRTRILATHHEDLVLTAASYVVRLTETGGASSAQATLQVPQTGHHPSSTVPRTRGDKQRIFNKVSDIPLEEVPIEPPQPRKFVEEEERQRGRIKWLTYKTYMSAAGGFPFWTTALGVFAMAQGALLGRAWLIKLWTEKPAPNSSVTVLQETTPPEQMVTDDHLYFYLGSYLVISLLAAGLAGVKFVFFCRGSIEASRKLFDAFAFTVLRAPLRWLDTVPQGRILNRFAADFSAIDTKLARDVSHFWEEGLAFLAIVIAGMFVSVYMLIPALLLGLICIYYTIEYLPGAREIKRLEATAQSPVFEHFGSTLSGLITIRCFKKTDDYLSRMHSRLDTYARSTWHLWLTQRWMSFRMGVIGALFAFAVATVVAGQEVDAALAGFALSFSLKYSEAVVEMIRRYSAMELDMNSTERVVEYANMTSEDQSGIDPPPTWPANGKINVQSLEAGYAPGLPSVLKGVTFDIEAGQRIGVVGRTGSGKSSLTLALFRFIEARSGRIMIDGSDISKIRLSSLRSRLTIIPQDPVLFSGTLRSNLDVFNVYDDPTLLQALRYVHLLRTTTTSDSHKDIEHQEKDQTVFESLDSPVSEGGLSLSQGQRQLVCLARAIVSRPKIMVLDEATSAVDMGTDTLIQESIRKQFSGSTLIVIAHRLSTIADFDKILVMDDGRVAEYDAPRTLLEKQNGHFRRMLNESGEKEKLERLVYSR